MQKKSFEELLREQTEGFEPDPKQGLWESIEKELPAEKRKKRMIWLWFPVVLLASAITAYALLDKQDEKTLAFSELKMNGGLIKNEELKPVENGKLKVDNGDLIKNEELRIKSEITSSPELQTPVDTIPKPQVRGTLSAVKPEEAKTDTVVEKDTVPPVMDMRAKASLPYRFYIDAVLNPVWSEVQLQRSVAASGTYDNRKETDRKVFSYGAGLHIGRQMGRFSIYSGLEYMSLGYKLYVRDTSYSKGYVANAPANFASADSFRLASAGAKYPTAYSENKFHYLCVPLGVGVNLFSIKAGSYSKVNFGVTANASYARLLSYNGLLYQEKSGLYVKQGLAEEKHINKNNFMTSFGLDISCNTGERGNVFLRPLYGFSMLPAENKPLKTNHRFWSIGLGFRWYL